MAIESNVIVQLRKAAAKSGESMYAVAQRCELRYEVVRRVLGGERGNATLATAEQIAAAMGYKLELRPIRRGAAKGR